MDAGSKTEMGKDRQLLRGVGAIDVHGWIGLGESKFLGLGQSRLIVGSLAIHFRDDVIAGSVQDGAQRNDLISGKALADISDDRNATCDRGFKSDRASKLACPVKKLRPMLGKQRFVCRHNVFSAFE